MGKVVFGWKKGRRQEINLGSKTHQIFVQIPTARLNYRISKLCEPNGIRFIETEESSTSKPSFLDSDELPTFGAKPEGWKESGRRVKRRLYSQNMDSKLMQTVMALQIFCLKYRQL
jgi:hypothetical protein